MEYSTWKKGQHFMTVLQTVPEHQTKVVIARVSVTRDQEGNVLYTAMRPDGKTVISQNHDRTALKKHLAEFGPIYASLELERLSIHKGNAKTKSQEPEIEQEPEKTSEQTPANTEAKTPTKELREIRDRGSKSRDRNITR